MIDQQRPQTKVTLEDLLRLKRAERPPIEFWTEFDRSLHAKQLAAIVEKRPWWRRSSWRQASRWSLPLSAAAALTVTFATLSHPTIAKIKLAPASLPNTVAQESQATVAQPSVTAPAPQAIVARVEPVTLSKPVAPAASEIENKPTMVAVAPVSSQVQTPSANRHLASVTEQIAGLALSNDSDSPTARFAALNTKDSLSLPQLGAFFDKAVAHLDSTVHLDKGTAVEPLTQVQTPRDARRARLVALLSLPGYTEDTNTGSTAMRSREHVASHLNEEALYDSISRLGLKGGGVSIQF